MHRPGIVGDGVFVGRQRQMQALASAARRAASGRPTVVLVRGEAGIGKTVLVRQACRALADAAVLWAACGPEETTLGFGVATQLLAAAGQGPAQGRGALEVGTRLLEVLAERSATGLVLAVVDDAQWADPSSLAALDFALRRLTAVPVLTVFTAREGELGGYGEGLRRLLGTEGAVDLALEGLTPQDLVEVAGSLQVALDPATADRLAEHTGGNPLYARMLLAEWDTASLAAFDTSDPLPAPEAFASGVRLRLQQCDRTAVGLAEAVAVLGGRARLGTAVAMVDLQDPARALDELESAGVLVSADRRSTVTLSHPMVRATIYRNLSWQRRAELHTRAAELALSRRDRVHHRMAAAIGHDDELAAEATVVAGLEASKGAHASAAELHLAARRLARSQHRSDAALCAGVEQLLMAGEVSKARTYEPDLLGCSDRPEAAYLRGLLAMVGGERRTGTALFQRSYAAAIARDDDLTAARAALQLGLMALNEGRGAEVTSWIGRAAVPDGDGVDRGLVHLVGALGEGFNGRAADWARLYGDVTDPLGADLADVGRLMGRGVLRMWSGDLAGSAADLRRATSVARGAAPFYLSVVGTLYLAETEYRLGEWDQALTHAELAASLADDGDEVWLQGLAHAVAVKVRAGRGDWVSAQHHLALAARAASALGDPANQMSVQTARARLAQARGRFDSGVRAARRLVEQEQITVSLWNQGIQPWAMIGAEACLATGDLAFADVLRLAAAERTPTGNPVVAAFGHRLDLLTASLRGDLRAVLDSYEQATDAARAGGQALDVALTHLDAGAALRRGRRRRDALRCLDEARDRLASLGARPFLQRCERELGAAGVRAAPTSDRRADLTPQELAVTTLVTDGRTNRDVAAELVVSVKTVEYHLRNVFAKLGVSSRAELTATWLRRHGS